MTLSRRDRAALTLAYECLRGGAQDPPRTGGSIYEARAALESGGRFARLLAYNTWCFGSTPARRMMSARLALYLRAVLRADLEDYGGTRTFCRECGYRSAGHAAWWSHGAGQEGRHGARVAIATRVICPLWERAPRTGEGRRTT